jgi:hypothetical protein
MFHNHPIETQADIFRWTASGMEFRRPFSDSAPIQLCMVCSDWRDIAIQTPFLWQSLEIDVTSIGEIETWVDTLRRWLLRSATQLLSIKLIVDPRKHFSQHWPCLAHIVSLLETLFEESRRWERIILDLTFINHADGASVPMWNSSTSLHFLSLKNLAISASTEVADWINQRTHLDNTPLPHLRTFHLDGGELLSPLIRTINLPLDDLDYLSLHVFPSIDDCFDVMRECKSTSHLTIGLGTLFHLIPAAINASPIEVYLLNLWSFHITSHTGIIGLVGVGHCFAWQGTRPSGLVTSYFNRPWI